MLSASTNRPHDAHLLFHVAVDLVEAALRALFLLSPQHLGFPRPLLGLFDGVSSFQLLLRNTKGVRVTFEILTPDVALG